MNRLLSGEIRMRAMSDSNLSGRRLIQWIMAAILVWGAVLAVGTYTAPKMLVNSHRTLVVYLFVAAFVVIWALLLKYRDSHRR